jgi:hypothetical protein
MNRVSLEDALDEAEKILKRSRALPVLDLCERIVNKRKADADFSYGDLIEAAHEDPRFRVAAGQIIGLSEIGK